MSEIIKKCGCCGAEYTAEGWAALPPATGGLHQHLPADEEGPAVTLEYRNCPCPGRPMQSTLVIELEETADA